MQNFVFHNPTKILFGKGTIPAIGPETVAFGSKVLLVYGSGSIKRNGIYQQVSDSLRKSGAEIVEHPGVQSNPLLSHVREGIELAKTQKCQVVCAIGGGSVIDEAKAICAGAFREAEFDILYGHGISLEGDVLDLADKAGIVEKSGSWYSYAGERLGQGRDNARQTLVDNPELMATIETRIRQSSDLPLLLGTDTPTEE